MLALSKKKKTFESIKHPFSRLHQYKTMCPIFKTLVLKYCTTKNLFKRFYSFWL